MKKVIDFILKIILFAIKAGVCLLLLLYILHWDFVVSVTGQNSSGIPSQINFFIVLSFISFIAMCVLLFKKTKFQTKLILGFIILIWFNLPRFLPDVINAFDIDSCLDMGGRWDYKNETCSTNPDDDY